MKCASGFLIAFALLFLFQITFGQSPYRYDVIATSNSNLQIFPAPSINNNGEVAFAGRITPTGGTIFTDYLFNQPRAVAGVGSTAFPSGSVQINDSRNILVQWSIFTTSPAQNYLAIVDGKATNSWTIAAAANGAGQFNDFNEIYPMGISFNGNGRPVFQTRIGNETTRLTAGTRPQFVTQIFTPSLGPIFRPIISDLDTTVFRKGNTNTSPIATLPQNMNNSGEVIIAQSAQGFTAFGQSPSISRKDEAISFYGNLDAAGATALGTNPGPGIFVSVKLPNGQRKIIRMAGRLIENISAPGGNDDGVCDTGETCVPGELGFNQAGSPIFFSSFDPDTRIDVGYLESGKQGIDEDFVFVSFVATPNIASDVPGQTFSSQKGLWTLAAKITADANGNFIAEKPEKAVKVVQIGDTVNGNVLTDIAVYDQMANNREKLAFYASSAAGNMIIRAAIDRTPIIFIPGVAGSELRDPTTNARLWAPESLSSDLTPLNINNPVKATDVIRKFKTGIIGPIEQSDSIYTEFLDSLKNNGYVEYNLDGDITRLNENCGGQNITELQTKRPTLFVFPYDWRQSNGGTDPDRNTERLRKYVQCIRTIYPDTNVNIVAHSMGGLLSRSYILQNPGSHRVSNLITIGTPWLGAPRAIHALETGSFIGAAFNDSFIEGASAAFANFVFASQIKQIMEGFPGGHQLLPSERYFQLGGNPLRINNTDYNFAETKNWMNSRHPNFNPGNQMSDFHTAAQDDFTNDTTGVNYYHIYGRQKRNKTVGRVEERERVVVAGIPTSGGVYARYNEYYPIATAGDGTVPIISSSRRTDAGDGLNATCGGANDRRCIGVCYEDKSFDKESDHNGMTKNTQVQAQVVQILKFAGGLIAQNTSFETGNCHLPPNNFAPQTEVESHFLTLTGITNVSITDSQGNTNQAISAAYKLKVPEVLETVIGNDSTQVVTPVDNSYAIRFTGSGQPLAIENIRGATNNISDATYIVRYDDVVIQQGVVAEVKLVNNLVDSLKYDSDGDGMPDTVISPSRTITNPQSEDLQAPQTSVTWGRRVQAQRIEITATDSGSGVKNIMYRSCVAGGCGSFQVVNGGSFSTILSGAFLTGVEVASEDNAGNRSNVIFYPRP